MTRTKQMTAIYVVAACIFGCREPVATRAREDKRTIMPPETDTMMTIIDNIEPVQVTSWQHFEQYDGKYMIETDMLQREPLKTRINMLLGRAVMTLKERLDVAAPIELENDILYNQGCRKHYCGTDEAAIAIDMRKDMVFVGISVNGIVTLYRENNEFTYPDKLLRWKQKFEN